MKWCLALLVFSTTAFGGDRKRSEEEKAEIKVLMSVRCVNVRENENLLGHTLDEITALVGKAYDDVEEQGLEFAVTPEAYTGDLSLRKEGSFQEFNRVYQDGEARHVMLSALTAERAVSQYTWVIGNISVVERRLKELGVKVKPVDDMLPLDFDEVSEIIKDCPKALDERVRSPAAQVPEELQLPDGLPPQS